MFTRRDGAKKGEGEGERARKAAAAAAQTGKTFDITEAEEEKANARFALRLFGIVKRVVQWVPISGVTLRYPAQKRQDSTSLCHYSCVISVS